MFLSYLLFILDDVYECNELIFSYFAEGVCYKEKLMVGNLVMDHHP